MGVFERAAQPLVLALMKLYVDFTQFRFLRPGEFALDQLRNIRQIEFIVEPRQVRFDFAAAHQVNASEEYTINVEQRFDASRPLFVEELPLSFGESEVVMTVMASDAGFRNGLQLIMPGRGQQYE